MSKEMLINVSEGEECRIAIVEEGRLEELYMERTSATSHVGNIYKGRVTNVEPSIQAAFVDFGLGRNGFLHISDLMPSYFGRRGEEIQETVGRKLSRRDRPPIQRCLRRGDEIVVQIIKEGIGTKGPTLTTYLSIPGRILVMMPGMSKMGVSRKIEDDDERRRLRQILDSLKPIDDVGFIIRTAGVGKTKLEIQRDLTYLTRVWQTFVKKRDSGPPPTELYTEGDLVTRTVRDVFSADVDSIVVDNKEVGKRVKEVIKLANPRARNRVELYEEPVPIFHKYQIEKEIEQMYSRHVPLPSGGSLVIDSTEAVVAIDVNSGKSRDHSDPEQTAFRTDLEAADEIPRQLRLRDLGGVIICDFIDLRFDRHRRELEERLHNNFQKDRAKTKVLRMSQFGIIEVTRQRMRPSLKRSIYFDCPHCKGAGLVKTPESMSLDVMRRLAMAIHDLKVSRVEMSVCADVSYYLQNKKRQALADLERQSGKRILIKVNPAMGLDEMKLELFDGRDGLVVLEELELVQQPHTTQLGPRPGQRTRGGRQLPVPVRPALPAPAARVNDQDDEGDEEEGDFEYEEELAPSARGGRDANRGRDQGSRDDGGRDGGSRDSRPRDDRDYDDRPDSQSQDQDRRDDDEEDGGRDDIGSDDIDSERSDSRGGDARDVAQGDIGPDEAERSEIGRGEGDNDDAGGDRTPYDADPYGRDVAASADDAESDEMAEEESEEGDIGFDGAPLPPDLNTEALSEAGDIREASDSDAARSNRELEPRQAQDGRDRPQAQRQFAADRGDNSRDNGGSGEEGEGKGRRRRRRRRRRGGSGGSGGGNGGSLPDYGPQPQEEAVSPDFVEEYDTGEPTPNEPNGNRIDIPPAHLMQRTQMGRRDQRPRQGNGQRFGNNARREGGQQGGRDGFRRDGGQSRDGGYSRNAGPYRDSGPRNNGPRDNGPRDNSPRDSGPRENGPRDIAARDNRPREGGYRDEPRQDVPSRDRDQRDAVYRPQARPAGEGPAPINGPGGEPGEAGTGHRRRRRRRGGRGRNRGNGQFADQPLNADGSAQPRDGASAGQRPQSPRDELPFAEDLEGDDEILGEGQSRDQGRDAAFNNESREPEPRDASQRGTGDRDDAKLDSMIDDADDAQDVEDREEERIQRSTLEDRTADGSDEVFEFQARGREIVETELDQETADEIADAIDDEAEARASMRQEPASAPEVSATTGEASIPAPARGEAGAEEEPSAKTKRSRRRAPSRSRKAESAAEAGEAASAEFEAPAASKPRRAAGGRSRKSPGKKAATADSPQAEKPSDGAPSDVPAAYEAKTAAPTGSADRHLASDEEIAPQPVSRPRSRRDLDAIPDDWD